MYVLYQLASIWRLPVFSTIEKKFKKGEPPSTIPRGSSPAFLAGKKTSTFFSDKTSHA
jgi:hypothetical protein